MRQPYILSMWQRPPAEFSLAPFWFWNDRLDEEELTRQLDAFQAHGVHAFVIHPRVGLPRDMGWMSPELLNKMRFVIEEAHKRGMWLILYDEGMYPSGSASGQVVAEDPAYQCRGLVRIDLDAVVPDSSVQGVQIDSDGAIRLGPYQSLIAETLYKGRHYAIIQRPIQAVIRGLHFINEDSDEPPEDEPLAADLLNPEAVASFIRHSYDIYHREFGAYFGGTIPAIFTDEPMLLGRPQEAEVIPGTADILSHVNAYLGYDFTAFLPALWDDDAPSHIRYDYERAVEHRLEETYYAQLYRWCEAHHIALTGHPAEPDATRHLRYFHIPGQDIVWRFIEPEHDSALEGRQSTQAKAASSMMLHMGHRRNANEFCGAYGHNLTFEEMKWLAHWLLIRGCNLLIPHAFYYSVCGPRLHERPPDVGLHSPWWGDGFRRFAMACRRLAWLNTDSEHVCHVAIIGQHHHLPWRAAKACFEHQIDFNYLDVEDLLIANTTAEGGIQVLQQVYDVLVVDYVLSEPVKERIRSLETTLSVVNWDDDTASCIEALRASLPSRLLIRASTQGLRVRHVRKQGHNWLMLFNERAEPVTVDIQEPELKHASLLDPYAQSGEGHVVAFHEFVALGGYEIKVLIW
ncbi:hypothetical protein G4Y79_20355 [Phototrophicus methaneseepsis]|uniref:Uncharacterized protein n=1 Tax=Phototrophicus methaneseepsis TaxID=2710758 RepID=A0A7S8E7W5_9CHLR|nr:hypothetical protein [Phototrophicus methaneseepsis]QPC82015.1 hypothetical protein G4Y79_20355 [Phototrophicus methaneseepsis]